MSAPVNSRHALAAVVGFVLSACLAVFLVTAPQASAGQFCWNQQLAAFGKGGDRCWGPSQNTLDQGWVHTQDRAGCVNIADGSNNLLAAWNCGAAGSWPGAAASIYMLAYPGTWRKAVIRNNNTVNPGWFGGSYQCLITC
jgi:hypothetical protein